MGRTPADHDLHAVAVELHLVDPTRADWRLVDQAGMLERQEAWGRGGDSESEFPRDAVLGLGGMRGLSDRKA